MSNNQLPPQSTETYVKLDDDHHNPMYSSIDTTMSGSMYQEQQPMAPSSSSSTTIDPQQYQEQQQPIAVDSSTTVPNSTTPQQQQQQNNRGILQSMGDSLNNLMNSMTVSSSGAKNTTLPQPTFNSTVLPDNPETIYEFSMDAGFLDCQMNHPTQLGQTSCRISFELMIQHKTIPNMSQRINKNEIGGNATFRPDLKLHVTAMDKNTTFSERIESLINSDPQRSLQNFFVYVIVKKVKNNLLDVQKINIAYSPCFTLGDFLQQTNNNGQQQQQSMYSFDLFQDQTLRTHVGKLGIRLSISAYSDYQYVKSLPSGFFASKAFTIPCTSKNQKVSALLGLTEKVKKWLNSYSSMIRVIEISNANDGKELAQVVLYQKL